MNSGYSPDERLPTLPVASARFSSARTQSSRSSGGSVSSAYSTAPGLALANARAASRIAACVKPVARSTRSRSNRDRLFLKASRSSQWFAVNSWSSSDSSIIARSIPPISAVSLPGRGRSHILATRASSVSRWSITMSAAPALTAFLIGTAATFCSSVIFAPTTSMAVACSSSQIVFVAARLPRISPSGAVSSGRRLDDMSMLLLPIAARANFCAT